MTSEVQRQEATTAVVMAEACSERKEVTLMKTRLLRKCQSSGSDTMLEIQNNCILLCDLKNIHQCLYIGGICVRYKCAVQILCGTSVRYKYYTSNLTGPRAHNIIYFNILQMNYIAWTPELAYAVDHLVNPLFTSSANAAVWDGGGGGGGGQLFRKW